MDFDLDLAGAGSVGFSDALPPSRPPQNDDGFVIDRPNLLLSIFPRKQTPLKIEF